MPRHLLQCNSPCFLEIAGVLLACENHGHKQGMNFCLHRLWRPKAAVRRPSQHNQFHGWSPAPSCHGIFLFRFRILKFEFQMSHHWKGASSSSGLSDGSGDKRCAAPGDMAGVGFSGCFCYRTRHPTLELRSSAAEPAYITHSMFVKRISRWATLNANAIQDLRSSGIWKLSLCTGLIACILYVCIFAPGISVIKLNAKHLNIYIYTYYIYIYIYLFMNIIYVSICLSVCLSILLVSNFVLGALIHSWI